AEAALAGAPRAAGRGARAHAAPPHERRGFPARHGVLLDPGQRVARREAAPRGPPEDNVGEPERPRRPAVGENSRTVIDVRAPASTAQASGCSPRTGPSPATSCG